MENENVFIPMLLGTPRKDCRSENVANWVHRKMTEREEIETKLFDVRDSMVSFRALQKVDEAEK